MFNEVMASFSPAELRALRRIQARRRKIRAAIIGASVGATLVISKALKK